MISCIMICVRILKLLFRIIYSVKLHLNFTILLFDLYIEIKIHLLPCLQINLLEAFIKLIPNPFLNLFFKII